MIFFINTSCECRIISTTLYAQAISKSSVFADYNKKLNRITVKGALDFHTKKSKNSAKTSYVNVTLRCPIPPSPESKLKAFYGYFILLQLKVILTAANDISRFAAKNHNLQHRIVATA